MKNTNTFGKEERISIQREIDLLFAESISFMAYPLRVLYVRQQPLSGAPCAVLISVPKKRFKHAVKRNRLKRLVREAYRLNKHKLLSDLQTQDSGLLLAFVYVGKEVAPFDTIEAAVRKALSTLSDKIGERETT